MRRFAILLFALAASTGLAACGGGDTTDGGEVFLAAASDVGPDPFTESVANPEVDLTSESSATVTAQPNGETQSTVGTSPRVYAGSSSISSCDKQNLVSALKADPGTASAWAGVIGIEADQISEYIAGTAAVVLRTDTRVTNYTLTDSQATPFQYVLQAGTAVLVDSVGVPRVRCACGNPLTPPVATSSSPSFSGTAWSGFNPDNLIVITPGPVVSNLTVVDVTSGTDVQVPVGAPQTSTSPSPTSPVTSATPSNANYTSCARRYGELVRDLTVAGGISAQDRQRWADQARDAAQAAQSGDLTRANEICEKTVGEMEQALNG